MNRTAFSLPAHSEYRTHRGLEVVRAVEPFTGGADRLDDLIDLIDRRRGVVLSSGTTVPGRYESFDLGFSDPPLLMETTGSDFSLQALNPRGEVLIAFLGDTLREPCVVITEKSATRLAGHILRGAAPVDEDQRTRRASVMSLVRDLVAALGANDDPLLGLFGAFAYDLVFQIEDLVLIILSFPVHPLRLERGLDRQGFYRAQQFTRNSRIHPWTAEGHAPGQAHHQVGLVAAIDGSALRVPGIGNCQSPPASATRHDA
jgi:hypothetical protein